MAKFKITWLKTGQEEIVNQSDRDTVDGYIECRFGANYDPAVARVEFVSDKNIPKSEPPSDEPKVEKEVKKDCDSKPAVKPKAK